MTIAEKIDKMFREKGLQTARCRYCGMTTWNLEKGRLDHNIKAHEENCKIHRMMRRWEREK